MIFAIDPGPVLSAYVVLDTRDNSLHEFGIYPNNEILTMLIYQPTFNAVSMHVEMIASYGMPVGATVFDTCVWIGRFIQAWQGPFNTVYRREVKSHLCHDSRAKDSNIRSSIIDIYGGDRQTAMGTKKAPGPLYGVSKDVWAALGVALTVAGVDSKTKSMQVVPANVSQLDDYRT